MIKIKNIIYFTILSLIINIFTFYNLPQNNVCAHAQSKGECVIDINSNRVLYANNENKKLPMASTTKILTAITVIDNFDINKIIKVPKSATNVEGSSIYLRENEHLSVKELLYGLMLRSGNDCAECLAQTLTTRDNFISLMNETAKKVGATNSNFTNPHGLHDDNHYTTALDLALITSYALKNDVFKDICSTKRIEISNEGYDYKRVLINKNKMLKNFDGCYGVKTGYTKKAGRCLVSAVKNNGLDIVSVVLDSPDMWERSKELISNSLSTYKLTKVLDKSKFDGKTFVDKNNNKFSILLEDDFYYPLKEGELKDVKFKINGQNYEEFIVNPQKSGIFEIYYQNKLIFSQNIFIIK